MDSHWLPVLVQQCTKIRSDSDQSDDCGSQLLVHTFRVLANGMRLVTLASLVRSLAHYYLDDAMSELPSWFAET
ncbi:MAG: hypothetical protein LAT65_01395 [Saccharospirillum sp.]|nr:hypothetical protein [Saccharospirillum sp.]